MPTVCLFPLSLLFPTSPPCPLSELYFIFVFMLPEELFGSLVFLFISGLGTLPKSETGTISGSPVAYQFLKCCPPGLDPVN